MLFRVARTNQSYHITEAASLQRMVQKKKWTFGYSGSITCVKVYLHTWLNSKLFKTYSQPKFSFARSSVAAISSRITQSPCLHTRPGAHTTKCI